MFRTFLTVALISLAGPASAFGYVFTIPDPTFPPPNSPFSQVEQTSAQSAK